MSSTDRPTDHIAADPDDLRGPAVDEDPGATTGLDRPFPEVGPVADPTDPTVDTHDLGLEDRPLD